MSSPAMQKYLQEQLALAWERLHGGMSEAEYAKRSAEAWRNRKKEDKHED